MSSRTETLTKLELILDRHGLANVLRMLAEIAGQKAEHIATNWQDASTAKRWDKAGSLLDLAAVKVDALRL